MICVYLCGYQKFDFGIFPLYWVCLMLCLYSCILLIFFGYVLIRVLGWNCRGLGNPRSVRALRNLVQQWDPDFVLLSETKLKKNSMDKKKGSVGFINGLVDPSHGRSGGLALL